MLHHRKLCTLLILLIIAAMLLPSFTLAEESSVRAVEFAYPSIVFDGDIVTTVDFSDEWFNGQASEYNHNIAKASLALAVTAFRNADKSTDHADRNLKAFLAGCGFENYTSWEYTVTPDDNTIANGMAMKRLQDEQGDYTLICIGVCGQGYGNEWLSNFAVEEDEYGNMLHGGFFNASVQVFKRLEEYIQVNVPEGARWKVWISGFSRAAAVSNLTAMLLSLGTARNGGNAVPQQIFAYTFGTPNTAAKDTVAMIQPVTVFNICGAADPVPKVPFSEWDYTRFGTTLYLPIPENTVLQDYSPRVLKAETVYESMTGTNEEFISSVSRNYLLRVVMGMLLKAMPNAKDYADGFQQALIKAWDTKGGMTEQLRVLIDTLNESYPEESISEALRDVRSYISSFLSRAITDAVGELTGASQTTDWVQQLTSGLNIAHEHFPQEYMAWMFSDNTPEELFDHPSNYTQVHLTNVEPVGIQVQNDEGTWIDATYSVSMLTLGNELILFVPQSGPCRILFTADQQTAFQAGLTHTTPQDFVETTYFTQPLTLSAGATGTLSYTPDETGNYSAAVLDLNGTIYALSNENTLTTAGISNQSGIADRVTSLIIVIPYMLTGLLLVLIILFQGLLALIRRRSLLGAKAPFRTSGKVMLWLSAALSLSSIVYTILAFIDFTNDFTNIDLTNNTIRMVSGILGWGINSYSFFNLLIHLLLCVMAITSISHVLSRRHFVNLCAVLLFLNSLSLLAASVCKTLTGFDLLIQLMPVLGLIAIAVGRIETPLERYQRTAWRPVFWLSMLTLIIFCTRQLLLNVSTQQDLPARFLKLCSSIPFLILSFVMWRRSRMREKLWVFLAALCAFGGDLLIDLNFIAGMISHTLCLILLTVAFIPRRRPTLRQIIPFIACLAVLTAIVLAFSSELSDRQLLYHLYTLPLSLAFAAVWDRGNQMRTGYSLLLISDIMLFLRFIYPGNALLDITSLFIYYAGIIILISDEKAVKAKVLRLCEGDSVPLTDTP